MGHLNLDNASEHIEDKIPTPLQALRDLCVVVENNAVTVIIYPISFNREIYCYPRFIGKKTISKGPGTGSTQEYQVCYDCSILL